MLQAIASSRLSPSAFGDQLRKQDAGAHLGGDEFALLLSGYESAVAAETVANRLLQEIQRPVNCGLAIVAVNASIGIALPRSTEFPTVGLHRSADLALYSAKEAGRGNFRLFDDSLQATVQQRRSFERDLRLALSDEELSLHYQPVVDVHGATLHRLKLSCAGKAHPR